MPDDTPSTEKPEPDRCIATTTRGTRCKNASLPDSEYCAVHQRLLAEETEAVVEDDVSPDELAEEERRARLQKELRRLVAQIEETEPNFRPPPFSPTALIQFLRENLDRLQPWERTAIIDTLRETLAGERFDVETWKSIWYMLQFTMQYQTDVLKRRLRGDYAVDPYGLDPELRELMKPFFIFLYRYWWRVEAIDVTNVPDTGPALLVSNHSGVLPWDGSMIAAAIDLEHPNPRPVRPLIHDWLPRVPFVASLLEKGGAVLGRPENAERLLGDDELVLVFPEGVAGVGKLFKDRYRLARFGRDGFARTALHAGAPIVPIAVVGAEEIYPVLAKSSLMARLLDVPYFPITPAWPWLGLLGTVPLPTKWSVTFGEPIETVSFGVEAANNLTVAAELSDLVRSQIQAMLLERLKARRSVFAG